MHKLILASQSPTRLNMLKKAGLTFEVDPAYLNEEKLIEDLLQKRAQPREIAETLACEKAIVVSKLHPYALVIGADQVLECEGKIYSKAKNIEAAKEKLMKLSGKNHRLISAVCIAHEGKTLWGMSDEAILHMNNHNEAFIDQYCASAGDILTSCAGAYAIEGRGAWLFSKVQGDHFTILGLPLVPLLNHLREKYGYGP